MGCFILNWCTAFIWLACFSQCQAAGRAPGGRSLRGLADNASGGREILQTSPQGRHFFGYFPGYWDNGKLASLARYVNVVGLAFAWPNCSFTPGSFTGTGLKFSNKNFANIKQAITTLKANGTQVVVSVGGASYSDWSNLNVTGLKDLVDRLGAQGVDVDYEPGYTGCSEGVCITDTQYVSIMTQLRVVFPKPQYLLTAAVNGLGAYGQGNWTTIKSNSFTGCSIAMSKSAAGQSLDIVSIMSYNKGQYYNEYDPRVAYDAYRSLFPTSKILVGFIPPPESWGTNLLTLAKVQEILNYTLAAQVPGNGAMMWQLFKSDATPNAQDIAQTACSLLGTANNCSAPIFG